MQTSTHVDHDGVVRLKLEGEIDLQVKDELDAALQALLASTTHTVIMDMQAVTFLDSSGIGILVRGYRQAEATGRSLRVTGADGMVLRVLEVTGVADLLIGGDTAAARHISAE